MAKPAFQQFTHGYAGFSRSVTVTLGSAPQEDDVIYLFVVADAYAEVTDPGGWTNVLGSNAIEYSDAHSASCHAHRVTSGEAGSSQVAWTLTNLLNWDSHKSIVAVVYRDVDPGSLFDDADSWFNDNNVTSSTVPVLAPTVTDGAVLAFVANDNLWDGFSTPSGWTNRGNTTDTVRIHAFEQDAATVAAVNTPGATISGGGSDEKVVITLIVPPIPAEEPPTTTSFHGWGIPI